MPAQERFKNTAGVNNSACLQKDINFFSNYIQKNVKGMVTIMNNTLVENKVFTNSALNKYISNEDGSMYIYLYGINQYTKRFLDSFPLMNIQGVIDETANKCRRFHKHEVFAKEEFIELINGENDKANIRIIAFVSDFELFSKEFVGLGISAVYGLYDGLQLLGLDNCMSEIPYPVYFTSIGDPGSLHQPPNREQGGIFKYDFMNNECIRLHSGSFRDLKRYKDGYIALKKDAIIVYNKYFQEIKLIEAHRLDLHGFAFSSTDDDIIYVVETGADQIGIYNIKNGIKLHEVNFSQWKIDNCHLNDIFIEDDYLYLSMFSLSGSRQSSMASIGKHVDQGMVIRINIKNFTIDTIIADNLTFPHTVLKINDDILFCDSLNRTLYCNEKPLVVFSGFLRGLYFDGYNLLVGQSRLRFARSYITSDAVSIETGIYCFTPSKKRYHFISIPNVDIYSIIT